MKQHTDMQDTDVEILDALGPVKRLAFENAYRTQKKVLIAEIERSLEFDLGNNVPAASVT